MSQSTSQPLADTVRAKLRLVSTATLTTCLFKRGLRNQYIQDVHPLRAGQKTMVGEAYTLRYIPAREDLNPLKVFEDRNHLQRRAVEDCPAGSVLIMDSRGDATAASAGAILIIRLMKRGAEGVVTDGGFRDSADIAALDIPAYQRRPSAPTNLTKHHAVDLQVPIACGAAPVFPGDILVGDQDGVVVLPAKLAAEIADEATEMTVYEDFVIEEVGKGRAVIGLYPLIDPQAKSDFQEWRRKTGR